MKIIKEKQRLQYSNSRSFTSSFGFTFSTDAEPYRPSRSGTASPCSTPTHRQSPIMASSPTTPLSYSSPRKSSLSNASRFESGGGPNTNGTINTLLYKTELCRSFVETGTCRYGDKCQFAHGEKELRHVCRHPKYKTEVCQTFAQTGTCKYGSRCRFIHVMPGEEQTESNQNSNTQSTSSSLSNATSVNSSFTLNNLNNNSTGSSLNSFGSLNSLNGLNSTQNTSSGVNVFGFLDDKKDDSLTELQPTMQDESSQDRLHFFEHLTQN